LSEISREQWGLMLDCFVVLPLSKRRKEEILRRKLVFSAK